MKVGRLISTPSLDHTIKCSVYCAIGDVIHRRKFSAQRRFPDGQYWRALPSMAATPWMQAARLAECRNEAPGQVRSWTQRNMPYFFTSTATFNRTSSVITRPPNFNGVRRAMQSTLDVVSRRKTSVCQTNPRQSIRAKMAGRFQKRTLTVCRRVWNPTGLPMEKMLDLQVVKPLCIRHLF